jgi:hypothetical protein
MQGSMALSPLATLRALRFERHRWQRFFAGFGTEIPAFAGMTPWVFQGVAAGVEFASR